MGKIDYAVFILSHGRPDNVKTYKTLKKQGYTGKVYIVCDDLDETLNEYRERFGDEVCVFNKRKYAKKTDTMDIENRMDVVVYARNAVYDIAREKGYRYIVVLDDDYSGFQYRWEEGNRLKGCYLQPVEKFFEASFEFLINANIKCYAWEQGGDFIGGSQNGRFQQRCVRKIMNTYFFDIENPVIFKGTLNEDMVASLECGLYGELVISSCDMSAVQEQTQQQSGGLTDAYLNYGTYVKSFYAVMMNPSCVKVAEMGDPRGGNYRMHHRVRYDYMCPVILSERYKKYGETKKGH